MVDDKKWYGSEEDYSKKADEEAIDDRRREREAEYGES